jgi:predicted dienelactone hydrolase
MRLLLAVLMVCVAIGLPHAQRSTDAPELPKVAAVTRAFVPGGTYEWREATSHALLTTIWYPADATARTEPHSLGPEGRPWFVFGSWAADAPFRAGRFPLVLLSHGTGGSSTMLAWLGVTLAAQGYVVAAVNHPGNNSLEEYTAQGFLLWWERARDISAVIDGIMKDSTLASHVDQRRIGAAGFSLGGYTMIALAGGRTDPERLRTYCRQKVSNCTDPDEFPGLFAKWDQLSRTDAAFRRISEQAPRRSYREPRIRSVFAIAPALGQAFAPASLTSIKIPVALVAGDKDDVVPAGDNAVFVHSMIRASRLTLLPNVAHYTFLAACTMEGQKMRPALCGDVEGVNRETVHDAVARSATDYFRETLR